MLSALTRPVLGSAAGTRCPARGFVHFDCLARQARSARIAPWSPPTSSSLEDEKHVPSLLLSTARGTIRFDCLARQARSARIAPWSPPTSSSLEDEKHVPSLLLSTAR